AEPFSGTGYYDRIPFPIRISKGRFAYADNQVFLTDFSGRIGANLLNGVTAQVDLTTNAWVTLSAKTLDISIADILSQDRFLEKIKKVMGPVDYVQGRLLFDQLHFEGPALEPDQWTWNLSGSGHDIQAGISPASREIQHLSGRFTISETSISTKDLTAVIFDLNWLSHVLESEQAASIALPLTLENGTVHISQKSTTITGSLLFASKIRLSVELEGDTLQDLQPQKVMLKDDALTDAMIMINWDTDKPLVRFEGHLDTRTLFAMMVTDSLLHRRLISLNGGVPMKIYTDDHSRLHIDTQQLYLEPLGSVLDTKKILKYRLLPDQTPIGLNADSMVYHDYAFSDIAAVVAYDRQKTEIQLVSADLCGLTISGHTALGQAHSGIRGTGRATIQATDQNDIEPVLSCLFPDRHLMDGTYSFVANLTAEGLVQSFQNNTNGRISFTSQNGRIYKMTLISRLLSVLNILNLPDMNQTGFKYRRFLVEAKVEKGIIHLEKAVIDAENMALIFSGQISPFENTLDLTCLVAPFKTIDTIIQYIPLVNTILSGRLVSFPAKATGTITDPVITPLHPSAVGEGLMNLLTDIIKSPGRLLEQVP
ncbi:MAG: AsmA-like C-terminal region-containing protein, partial [Desulfobacteraceae bacterium]|nr:AsmA-like C-terminal region-containing protein [Desulfobacteraceae bacterium]